MKENTAIRRQKFTLLEIIIVIVLIGVTAILGVGALTNLLDRHYFQKEVEHFKNLLQELQIEALTLGSDMELQIKKENHWRVVFKSSEKILKSETIDLKHIHTVFLNHQSVDRFKITIFSTGRVVPAQLIELRGNKSSLWVDLREPIQIKFTAVKPADIIPKQIPKKPKGNYGPQKLRV